MTAELNLERMAGMVRICVVRWGGESEEVELADEIERSAMACSDNERAAMETGEAEGFAVRECIARGVCMEG